MRQRLQPHRPQVSRALVALMNTGKDLDLLSNLGVGGEIFGFDATPAKPFGRFPLGCEIFRFEAFIHEAQLPQRRWTDEVYPGSSEKSAVFRPINAAQGQKVRNE